MSKIRGIIRLKEIAGLSQRQISRALQLSRPVVDHYLKQVNDAGLTWSCITDMSDDELLERITEGSAHAGDPRFNDLQKRLPKLVTELGKKHVTRQLLWEEYRRDVPNGYGYSRFCFHLQTFSGDTELSMHLEHKAGNELFIDYAGDPPHLTDPKTGIEQKVALFVATLPSSGLIYTEATVNEQGESTIAATRSTLEYIGGSPRIIVPDNLKAAVLKPDRYEPDINATFDAFAAYYGCAVIPARPARPKDKALVEAAVHLVYTRILAPLRDRRFATLSELNTAIWEYLDLLNNRPMQKIRMSRRQRFEGIEGAELSPLPAHPYELRQYTHPITVQPSYHVYFREDQHYYSVPFQHRKAKVRIAFTASAIEIYRNNERVAVHRRDARPHAYTTNYDHMPSTHQWYAEWSPQRFLSWAESFGAHTQVLIRSVLEEREVPEQAFRSCLGILKLADRYGGERLEAASRRAVEYGIHSYKGVKNILERGMDHITGGQSHQQALPFHENVRGADAFTGASREVPA